jgi:hypothetical protein
VQGWDRADDGWDRPEPSTRWPWVALAVAVVSVALLAQLIGSGLLGDGTVGDDLAGSERGELPVQAEDAGAGEATGGPRVGEWVVHGAPGGPSELLAPTVADGRLLGLGPAGPHSERTAWAMDLADGVWRSLGTPPVERAPRAVTGDGWWVLQHSDGLAAYDLDAGVWRRPLDRAGRDRLAGGGVVAVADDTALALRHRGPEAETLAIDLRSGELRTGSSPFRDDAHVTAEPLGDGAVVVTGRLASRPAPPALAIYDTGDGWRVPQRVADLAPRRGRPASHEHHPRSRPRRRPAGPCHRRGRHDQHVALAPRARMGAGGAAGAAGGAGRGRRHRRLARGRPVAGAPPHLRPRRRDRPPASPPGGRLAATGGAAPAGRGEHATVLPATEELVVISAAGTPGGPVRVLALRPGADPDALAP